MEIEFDEQAAGMYNPGTYQQAAAAAHYYQQMYGSSSSPSPAYYYGYSMQGSRGTFSAATQRFQSPTASYLYYPTTTAHHLPADAASFTPPPPPLLQHPPHAATTRLQFPSPTTGNYSTFSIYIYIYTFH